MGAHRPVTLIAVDNHVSVTDGVSRLAAEFPEEISQLGSHAHVDDIDLSQPAPDVVVLDLYLGRDDESSVSAIPRLIAWGAQVLLHTSTESPVPLREAVAAGAAGLALKNDGRDALKDAILAVADGEFACSSALAHALLHDPRLTPRLISREIEVIQGLEDGLTLQQIARRQEISYETTKTYLKSIRSKYLDLGRDISNSHSIVREARQDGWIPPRGRVIE